jgi:hypothetical protein
VAGVEQARDAGVIERSQHLALAQKAVVGRQIPQEFDGCVLPYFAIVAFGQEDGAHASASQQFHQLICSAAIAYRRFTAHVFSGHGRDAFRQGTSGGLVELDEGFDFSADFGRHTSFFEPGAPVGWRKIGYLPK